MDVVTQDLRPVYCRGCGAEIGKSLFAVSGWCARCRPDDPPRPPPAPLPDELVAKRMRARDWWRLDRELRRAGKV